jgi:prepilin-type processing-associated H-X9-DG protein
MVLASLLLPALNSARERAKESLCRSNQKQLALAAMMYTDEYNGWMLSALSDKPLRSRWWFDKLETGSYIPLATKITCCPSTPSIAAGAGAVYGSLQPEVKVGYTWNGRLGYSEDGTTWIYPMVKYSIIAPQTVICFNRCNAAISGVNFSDITLPAAHCNQKSINVLFTDGHVELNRVINLQSPNKDPELLTPEKE